jgi:hypothetical protein
MTVAKCFAKTFSVPLCSRAFLVLFAAGRAAFICVNLRQLVSSVSFRKSDDGDDGGRDCALPSFELP